MGAFFSLIEQLAALTAPSVLAMQGLLGVVLVQAPNANEVWRFYEAQPASGSIASVDYREPGPGATRNGPFLVLTLRGAPVLLRDIEQRYGDVRITDLSAHHPQFIGYSATVSGREVAFSVDTKTSAVLSVSIDYSLP